MVDRSIRVFPRVAWFLAARDSVDFKKTTLDIPQQQSHNPVPMMHIDVRQWEVIDDIGHQSRRLSNVHRLRLEH
jgi:hypothetical protein